MTSEEEYPFIFTKLTERYEGDMINRFGRPKSAYIGKKCRQVGYYPPYVFEFEDGAKWALYAGQVTPVSMRYRVIEYGKDKPVICVETEERFPSATLAARWAGVTRQAINRAVYMCGTAGGYNWIREDEGV